MSACPLGICDGSGWIDDEAERLVRPCRCRAQLVAGRRARALSATIPKRYRGVSFDRPPLADMPESVTAVVRRYVRRLDEQLDAGRGLWLIGDIGTGKTALAMLVSQRAIEQGRTVAIYSVPRLLADIRSTFEAEVPGAYTDFIDRLTSVDLLHLDDLGAERTSPWVLEQLYTIINTRYEDERSVIVTANGGESREDDFATRMARLREQIGGRTVSRLEEICDIVPVFGSDRRELRIVDRRPASVPSPGDPGDTVAPAGPPGLRLAPDAPERPER